jgi:DNA-binding SARP family transcriptional activator
MEFQLLGPLEVRRDDGPLSLGGPKPRALLALLLLHANETLPRERLIDELWGERPPATATKALQVYVSQLRKLLEPDQPLETTPSGYRIRLDPDQLDLDRFDRLIADGRRALDTGDARTAGQLFTEALSLWRGPALADLAYEPFAQAEITRLEDLRLAALEGRIEAELQLGRHAEVTGELEALAAEHPVRENLRGLLMLALYRSERQAEALAAYQEARRVLVEELGIDPGRKLRELEQAILRQDPVLDLAAAPSQQWASAEAAGRFVGRERELEHLLTGLESAVGGRGGLYLLAGEPGIGKSRLTDELVGRARERGAQILVGRCWEAGGAPAYWPWVQALRSCVRGREPEKLRSQLGAGAPDLAQLVPEIRELLPGLPERDAPESEGARFRLFEAAASFLTTVAKERPVVLALDDLHAADEPSLLLLRFLARELAESRVLVVAAYRDVDPTLRDPLVETLAELRREPVTHSVALAGLGESAVAAYIEDAAGRQPSEALVEAIHGETEGNPLFVGEVVRLLVAEHRFDAEAVESLAVPQGIRDVIDRRLGHLPPECLELLTLAATLGREFAVDALEAVSGTHRDKLLDTLDEAMEARLVSELPGAVDRLRFAHALIRDAVYESLTPARRSQLHRRVGDALEELYADDPALHLAELAHHFVAALPRGERSKALRYSIGAAGRAEEQLAFEEAARLYELALNLVQDEVQRCDLMLALGGAQARAGDTRASKDTFLVAAEIAEARKLPQHLARAALGYGGMIAWAVSRDDAKLISLSERALAALGADESPLRIRLLARLAGGPYRDASSPPELKHAYSEEALELARRLGDPADLAFALEAYVHANLNPDRGSTFLPVVDEWIESALAAGDKERAAEGFEHRFQIQLERGEVEVARADLEEVVRIASELRQPTYAWLATVNRTLMALLEGRFDEAERLLDETVELGRAAPLWNAEVSYRLQLYVLRRAQGRLDELVPVFEADADLQHRTYPIVDCVQARLYDSIGRTRDSRRIFENLAADDFRQIPFDEEWLVSLGFLAELAQSFDDTGRAEFLLEQLKPYAGQVGVAYPEICTGSVARSAGLAAATLSRWDEAERYFQKALEMNQLLGARPWLALTQEDYARMLLARNLSGDQERSAELLAQALESYRELGMTSSN